MIQDIGPKAYHVEYENRFAGEGEEILLYKKGEVMARIEGDEVHYPKATGEEQARFLFKVDEEAYFLGSSEHEEQYLAQGYSYQPIRDLRAKAPEHAAFAAMTGFHLSEWYRKKKFCGCCGRPMQHSDKERMVYCEPCRNMVYPRISPAVIVGVISGDRLLLTKYAANVNTNRYALVAGFTEIGEPVEDTVHREVLEETGLHVKNLKFYKSQPWGFSQSLLMGFYCELDGDDTVSLDDQELGYAGWMTADEIELTNDNISLTREMIVRFKKLGRKVLEG